MFEAVESPYLVPFDDIVVRRLEDLGLAYPTPSARALEEMEIGRRELVAED